MPKSSFGELLRKPIFLQAFKSMSDLKTVPKGLRKEEVERGNFKPAPIPYIPVEDDVVEKVKSESIRTYKVKIDDKTSVNASVWTGGSPEGFLIHVISAMGYIERCKLCYSWTSFKKEIDEYVRDVANFKTLLVDAKDDLKKAEDDARQAIAAQEVTAAGEENVAIAPNVPPDIQQAITSAKNTVARWMGQIKSTKEAIQVANKEKQKAGDAIFALYENLLHDTALLKWNGIVAKQIGVTSWTDLKGNEHKNTTRAKTPKSFKDCVQFHLLQVFNDDAAERQKFYLSTLKKPAKVTIRHFAARVEQLNSYINHLPGLVDSPKALPSTKKAKAYDEAELAQAILRMCPTKWQDHFNLTQGIIPQSLRHTIETLKNIEQFQESSKPPAKPNGDGKKGSDGKRKVNFQDKKVPRKKSRTGKFCDLCKKHGGAHMSHNTADCKRYSKDGSLKKGFKKPDGHGNPKGNQSFATFVTKLDERFAAMTDAIKDMNKKRESDYE